jgi:hypothetical protein
VVILPDQREQPSRPGLQGSAARILHELVVDAEIGELAAKRARRGADCGAHERHQENHADEGSQKSARQRACRGEVHHLVQLDLAVGVLDDDNRILKLDQIVLLQFKDLLTDLLGFLFRGKGDENESLMVHTPNGFGVRRRFAVVFAVTAGCGRHPTDVFRSGAIRELGGGGPARDFRRPAGANRSRCRTHRRGLATNRRRNETRWTDPAQFQIVS